MNPATETLSAATHPAELHSRAEQILLPGLGLGIAGDYLLRFEPAGPGLCVWLTLLTAAALWLTRAAGGERWRTLARWSALAVGAALITVVRDLEALIPCMLLVILLCAVLTALETSGITLRSARVRDYFFTGFRFPLQMLTQTPRLLSQADLSAVAKDQRLSGIMRGLLIAVPVLIVFGALFASADAGFTRYATVLTGVVSPRIFEHLLLALVFAWAGTSLLGLACRKAAVARTGSATAAPISFGTTEAHVVLALVSALFIAFVILQLGYLFGGSDVITSTSGLTVAEYARRGFFELLLVAALALGLLLVLDATDCERRILRRYGFVLVACVLIILASALQRMFLYTDAFGLSLDRLSALAVMLWQAFNLVSFAFTVLRGNVKGFASALAISGIASLLLLGLVNPAAIVAKVNLERTVEDGRPLDVQYLMNLSADVVPSVLDNFAALPAKPQCEIARYLLVDYPVALDNTPMNNGYPVSGVYDWRRWNLSYAAAAHAVAERVDALHTAAGLPRVTTSTTPQASPC